MAEPEAYEANALIKSKLDECTEELEDKLEAHVLAFSGDILPDADLFLRWRYSYEGLVQTLELGEVIS
ncbi:MAG: hypothetical protein ACYTDV_10545 [Planctomycetota bacterium]|jgi:hypothetical protein